MFFTKMLAMAGMLASVALSQTTSAAATLPTIKAVGSKFYTANGDQYFIKGKQELILVRLNVC